MDGFSLSKSPIFTERFQESNQRDEAFNMNNFGFWLCFSTSSMVYPNLQVPAVPKNNQKRHGKNRMDSLRLKKHKIEGFSI